ncbi:transmembrane 4 L6 family member 5 [Scleropages formosus]|uniref:Transmembrane 4 L six family member 21a n=1 Tax=Scleropages formosus TaxID=113540 RepID=A0A8C9S9T3_SCLFO|nr:transmembrane 4 L6 family member 5-like [Scleropages formosus]XP_018586992.1 transmembrane 4 L6 family member 5-like [Scleropages formosus]
MCTAKCARCIGAALYPLALISILCNIVLFFPDGKTKYVTEEREGYGQRITEEVKYMGGLVGGGLMVLVPAIHIQMTGKDGCCGNRCGMFLSILFAAVGVAGALYSFTVAVMGLVNGPTCRTILLWSTPFKGMEAKDSYLQNKNLWSLCTEPPNIVQFNIGLFSTLVLTSILELVLCGIQMINGLFGCLCGTCKNKGPL